MFIYEQRTGRLVQSGGTGAGIIALGYAGSPACVNDPSQDHIRNCGPLPKGEYIIRPSSHPRFAYPAFRLIPREGTEMHGRSGFWVHGDNRARNRSASTGCIVIDKRGRERLLRALPERGLPILKVIHG